MTGSGAVWSQETMKSLLLFGSGPDIAP